MTLATEQTDAPTLLETWTHNERMRHIPSVSWMIQKLDGDLRRRVDLLWSAYANLAADNPLHAGYEKELRALVRCLDRVANVAKRSHANHQHPPVELGARLQWSVSHTVSNLNAVDAETFGRRYPFQTFERSNAEPLWAAMLAVIEHVHRLTELARNADRGIDERMYEGLVTLQLDSRPMA